MLQQLPPSFALPQIIFPQLDPTVARPAGRIEGGENAFVAGATNHYDAVNDGPFPAQAYIRRTESHLVALESEEKRLQGQLRGIRPVGCELERNPEAAVPWIHRLMGAGLLGLTGLGLFMGNQTATAYAVASGTDLFAANSWGATLMAGAVLMTGASLKALGSSLQSDVARRAYQAVMFTVSIAASLVWVAAFALAFAPHVGGDASWLTGGGDTGHTVEIVLVASSLIADIASGYCAFAGAERLALANYRRVAKPSAEYQALEAKLAELGAHISELHASIGEAENWLLRLEAGRNQVADAARLMFWRERERHQHQVAAATATAEADFLN